MTWAFTRRRKDASEPHTETSVATIVDDTNYEVLAAEFLQGARNHADTLELREQFTWTFDKDVFQSIKRPVKLSISIMAQALNYELVTYICHANHEYRFAKLPPDDFA